VPLLAATTAEWIADDFVARRLGLRACDAVTVLEMACADQRSPDWASLDGASLSARGEQLLAALAVLAAAGVVHGDVKPRNIVYRRSREHVRMIDFGASAFLDLSGRSKHVPARGTPWFMAPEVAESEDGWTWTTLTPAVDVFGAGRPLALN
jgi:serine/threonine protein kinase